VKACLSSLLLYIGTYGLESDKELDDMHHGIVDSCVPSVAALVLSFEQEKRALIGVGRAGWVPGPSPLRTVRAGLPHTAL